MGHFQTAALQTQRILLAYTFSEHGLHAEIVLLQAVDERHRELLVHILRHHTNRTHHIKKRERSKCKGRCVCFVQFLSVLAGLPWSIWKNRMNSTVSSKPTDRGQTASAARNWKKSAPKQTRRPSPLLLSQSFFYGTHWWPCWGALTPPPKKRGYGKGTAENGIKYTGSSLNAGAFPYLRFSRFLNYTVHMSRRFSPTGFNKRKHLVTLSSAMSTSRKLGWMRHLARCVPRPRST